MNFYYKWIVYIINKQIISKIFYIIICTYLQNCTIQFHVYISIFLDKYTYKNVILYIVKSILMFRNTLLYLNLGCLIVEHLLKLKLDLFTKHLNITRLFFFQIEPEL